MWKIIQQLLPAVLIILFLTQLVIPLLFNKKTWWLFRPEEKPSKPENPSTLVDEIKATKTYVDEAKAKASEVKQKVEGNLKSAEDLKKEADNLI
jgi:hypothetical protein